MSQHTELRGKLQRMAIECGARLRGDDWCFDDGALENFYRFSRAADALQAMEFALDATATPKSLTTKREKVILLTGAQNENSLLRAQLATQSLRLEDANGLLRYVADQRDAALGKLQALERVPMTEEVALKIAHRRATTYTHRSDPHYSGYAFVPYTLMDFVRDLEAHHGITPPESK